MLTILNDTGLIEDGCEALNHVFLTAVNIANYGLFFIAYYPSTQPHQAEQKHGKMSQLIFVREANLYAFVMQGKLFVA